MSARAALAVATGCALGGVAHVALAARAGSLAVTPAILEHAATPGVVGTMSIANTTSRPMAVTVTPRPWLQAPGGQVSPDRRHTLTGQVSVASASFTLAAQTTRVVTVTLPRAPSGGSLYGALEVVGRPGGAPARSGIVAVYRIVSSLRLDPAAKARRFSVTAGAVKIATAGRVRHVTISLRNAGNTIAPIAGRARISGPRGAVTTTIAPLAVVPGHSVTLALANGALPAGRYRAAVTLKQGTKTFALTRAFTLR